MLKPLDTIGCIRRMMDIATYRLNRPRGQFSEKICHNSVVTLSLVPTNSLVSYPDSQTRWCKNLEVPAHQKYWGGIHVFFQVLTNSVSSHDHSMSGNTTRFQPVKHVPWKGSKICFMIDVFCLLTNTGYRKMLKHDNMLNMTYHAKNRQISKCSTSVTTCFTA